MVTPQDVLHRFKTCSDDLAVTWSGNEMVKTMLKFRAGCLVEDQAV